MTNQDESKKSLWLRWVALCIVKLFIYGPFIILGPVMIVLHITGLLVDTSDNFIAGSGICTVFCLFCVPDLYMTIVVPWKGNRDDWPVWWDRSAGSYIEPFVGGH